MIGTEPLPTNANIWIRCIVYAFTNSSHPLLVDLMKHQGAAAASTLMYIAPTYLAMALFGFGPRKKSIWEERHRFVGISILAIGDISHQILEKVGLIYAGSGVYMMAASTTSVWTALISKIILRKQITSTQWAGIILICTGLSLKSFQASQSACQTEILGALLTVIAAMLHSLVSVLNERYLTEKEPIDGPNLVFFNGIFSTTLLLLWTVVWTIPRWDDLVVSRIREKSGSPYIAISCFFLLLICGMMRSATLWYILKHLGAISSGVLKGIRTPTVFFLSHIFYCHLEPSQCISPIKVCAAVLCTLGVIVYSLELKKTKTEKMESKPLLKEFGQATKIEN